MSGSWLAGRAFTWRHAGLLGAMLLAFGCEQGPVGNGEVSAGAAPLTGEHVVATGLVCAPTGKHATHQRYACTACHQCAGTLSFDPAVAGSLATFDAAAKTCSSVACHGVPSGSFSYTSWDYALDQGVTVTVPYGGSAGTGQASWYATAAGACTACHGYPPTYNGVAYPWHSGTHGITVPNGNTCQLCHPDATGAYVYSSYVSSAGGLVTSCPPGTFCAAPGTITVPSRHANGTLDVAPQWSSRCYGCH